MRSNWLRFEAPARAVFLLIAALTHPVGLRVGWRELLWIAAYGVVGLAIVNWLYFVAIARMPVSVALLIEFTAPCGWRSGHGSSRARRSGPESGSPWR